MSEEARGGFLARWSRKKAASQAAPPENEAPQLGDLPDTVALPAIESLGADSDYTVFLARGVCRALQAQALRIAWATDPAIADFRGMAEYAWDFNAPGYGDLAPGDDAAAWLSQIVRSGARLVGAVTAEGPADPTQAAIPAPDLAPPIAATLPAEALPVEVQPPEPLAEAAVAANAKPANPAFRRRHGGAVPV